MSEQDELSEPAFAAIGLAVEPVTPPAALRAQILSDRRCIAKSRPGRRCSRWRATARSRARPRR